MDYSRLRDSARGFPMSSSTVVMQAGLMKVYAIWVVCDVYQHYVYKKHCNFLEKLARVEG